MGVLSALDPGKQGLKPASPEVYKHFLDAFSA